MKDTVEKPPNKGQGSMYQMETFLRLSYNIIILNFLTSQQRTKWPENNVSQTCLLFGGSTVLSIILGLIHLKILSPFSVLNT